MSRSNRAEVVDTAANAVQVLPPSIEYCQEPSAVPPSSTTAIPSTAPTSASVIESPTMLATLLPAGSVASSLIAASVGLPLVL